MTLPKRGGPRPGSGRPRADTTNYQIRLPTAHAALIRRHRLTGRVRAAIAALLKPYLKP